MADGRNSRGGVNEVGGDRGIRKRNCITSLVPRPDLTTEQMRARTSIKRRRAGELTPRSGEEERGVA